MRKKPPIQMRTGDLGELLQEAHLDHRIQLNFDGKNGEDDDEDEETTPKKPPRRPTATGEARASSAAIAAVAAAYRTRPTGRARPEHAPWRSSRRSAQTSDCHHLRPLEARPGDLVQIAKEPIAKKGARITSHIALPALPGLHATSRTSASAAKSLR